MQWPEDAQSLPTAWRTTRPLLHQGSRLKLLNVTLLRPFGQRAYCLACTGGQGVSDFQDPESMPEPMPPFPTGLI